MKTFTVGQTVYYFDENHRVYKDNRSAPVYREYYCPIKIVSESPELYQCEHGFINKRSGKYIIGRCKPQQVYSQQEIEDAVWEHDYAYVISEAVRTSKAPILRQIASIIGFIES